MISSFLWCVPFLIHISYTHKAQCSGPPQKLNPKFWSYAAVRVRTDPGINLLLMPSDWDHPVKFYWRKSEIFWANLLSKTRTLALECTKFILIWQLLLGLYWTYMKKKFLRIPAEKSYSQFKKHKIQKNKKMPVCRFEPATPSMPAQISIHWATESDIKMWKL